MGRICGTGEMCENTCPVMEMGRICPPFATFMEELRILMPLSEVAPQPEPQPV